MLFKRKLKRITIIQITLCLIISCSSHQVLATKLIISADAWCPINCLKNQKNKGYMVEIAKHIFKTKNITVEYKVMPWARAIVEAEKGNIDAVFGAFKGDASHFIYPNEELGLISNSFFSLKSKQGNYSNVQLPNNLILGTIKGYDYGEKINQHIREKEKNKQLVTLTGDNDLLVRAIKMLLTEKIDILIESDIVFWHTVNKLGLAEKFKYAGPGSNPMKVYIAFSPANKESINYANILSEGIKTMRESGELAKILIKYGLHDWK